MPQPELDRVHARRRRQLLDAALFSRDADPMQFALWMLALVSTPATFFAFRQSLAYTALTNAPAELVLQVAMAHRLFFVVYAMIAAALLPMPRASGISFSMVMRNGGNDSPRMAAVASASTVGA